MYALGTVCMLIENNTKKNLYTIGTVTQKAMHSKASKTEQKEYLLAKIKQNLTALHNQIKHISALPEYFHCFRISSNLLPMYDHPIFSEIYQHDDVASIITNSLKRTGQMIKDTGLTVGVHPDQYCIINSLKSDVVEKSIGILEYHADIGLMLGLDASQWNSNIHLYSKNKDLSALQDLRDYTRNTLSFENGDTNRDTDSEATLNICEQYGIRALFDMHHHRVVSGDLITPDNDLVKGCIATWKDRAPLFHVSQGKEHTTDKRHSDIITDPALVTAVQQYLLVGCVEVEAKHKNLAVSALVEKVFK